MSTNWTEEKNAEFRAMRLARVPVTEMAARFGTTPGAIYAHARLIGVLVMGRKVWTPEEVATLRDLDAARLPIKDIAGRLDRPEDSVTSKLRELATGTKRKRFWKDDDGTLIALATEGKDAAAIGTALSRTPDQVRDRMRALARLGMLPGEPGRSVGTADVVDVTKAARAPREGLTEAERERLALSLRRKNGLLDAAKEFGVDVRWLRRQARDAGFAIQTRRRRPLDEAARAEIVAAAVARMPITTAIRELGRDIRTLKSVAAEAGHAFPAPAPKKAKPFKIRLPKFRDDDVEERAKAPKVRTVLPRTATARPAEREVVPLVAVAPPRGSERAPRGRDMTRGRPSVPRVRDAAVLDRRGMADAVAKFLAEREVTKESLAPVEATVRAIRRKGYTVTREGDAFLIDGRVRLTDEAQLAGFARARSIEVPMLATA